MPVQKDSNIVKIAVKTAGMGLNPQLIQFNQKQPLTGIIEVINGSWTREGPANGDF